MLISLDIKFTRRILVAAFAGVLMLHCVRLPLSAQEKSSAQLSEDESAVYTVLFQEIYQAGPGRPIIVSDQTALGVPPGMVAKIPLVGPQTAAFLAKVLPETKQDWTLRNHASSEKLPSPCHLAPECIVENVADLAPQVKDPKAWGRFFKKHPNTPGVIVVSRIGFNADHTQAVVYTGYDCGMLCGQGEYVWLSRSGKTWKLEDHTVVWISQK